MAKDYFKYFFVIILVILGYWSYLVVSPFIVSILTGLVLAYVFQPVFRLANKRIKSKALTAFILSVLIIVVLSVPTVYLIQQTAQEAKFFYVTAKEKLFDGNVFDVKCPQPEVFACRMVDGIRDTLSQPEIRSYIETGIAKFSDFVLKEASSLVFSLPKIFLGLFVAFFVMFYAISEGPDWVKKIKSLLPIRKTYQKEVFRKIDSISHAVIYGSVLVALIQGTLGGIGFFIFGVNSPILFGILMAIFAMIPLLGTAVIWFPAAAMMLLEGYVEAQSSLILRGTLLMIYGTVVVAGIDNLLKPKLIGGRAKVHPVLVLVGVLGGIAFLGFIGFVVGPLILSLFAAFLDIYEREKKVFLK